jgi:hypothetical protein
MGELFMKRSLTVFLGLILLAASYQPIQPAAAAPQAPPALASHGASLPQGGPSAAPAVLCLPGIYMYDPGDCVAAGPSAYQTQLAGKGITLPLPPLAYTPVDPVLGNVEVRYGEVRNKPAPIYGSIEDALKANKKAAVNRLDGDVIYISYVNEHEANGRRLYEVAPGQWMKANDVTRIGVLPRAQGITFNNTPTSAFGWVLTYFAQSPTLETKRTPGNDNPDYTGHVLNLYDIVPVFSTETVNGENWYLVGADEWVPSRFIARVIPSTTPPQGVTNDRWIEVNLEEQTLAVYDRRQLVFATIIASGADPFWTRPGLFQIYEKHDTTPMRGASEADLSDAYYLEDVPWTMYFDDARALHGAYWRAKMGFVQSHGCVNLTVADAHWLYNWGQLGDWVYVWDPSGQTPTDPGLYQSGGY